MSVYLNLNEKRVLKKLAFKVDAYIVASYYQTRHFDYQDNMIATLV